jgi:Tol biopolymer transport system component
VHDRRTHRTQRVSVAHTGGSPAGRSNYPAISANGRYVAFMSSAPDLVADGSASGGLFLRDLRLSTTVLVSRTDTGAPVPDPGPPDISGDGRYVTFATSTDDVAPGDRNGLQDVVVRDLRTGRNKLASVSSGGGQGDDNSAAPAISPDGRYVTFLSWATNLVPGDHNGFGDIFLHDRRSGTTERVSVQTSGAEADSVSDGATVSSGGRAVAITSYATNLAPGDTDHAADVYVWVRR